MVKLTLDLEKLPDDLVLNLTVSDLRNILDAEKEAYYKKIEPEIRKRVKEDLSKDEDFITEMNEYDSYYHRHENEERFDHEAKEKIIKEYIDSQLSLDLVNDPTIRELAMKTLKASLK